jgi:hypothetical protein
LDVSAGARLKLIPLTFVISVKVTGDWACGALGAGFRAGTSELYDFPVRWGVLVGDGLGFWAIATLGPVDKRKTKQAKTTCPLDARSDLINTVASAR